MRALTSLDNFFLAAEDGRTVTNLSSLVILERPDDDAAPLTRDDLADHVAERLHLLPPLRWRLAEVPFGLGHPYWVDGDVDLDFHIRELALVAPGDRAALESQVARLSAHPMDRSRPLWEMYLIHGLADGGVAVLTKLHHAAVDGVSAAEVMSTLLDDSPAGRRIAPAPRHRAEQAPSQVGMLARGVIAEPRRQLGTVGAAGRMLTNLDHVAVLRSIPGIRPVGRMVRGIAKLGRIESVAPPAPSVTAPRLRLNGKITSHRQVALTSVPLEDVKELKRALDCTINDVVVALSTGAVRRWLERLGALPDQPLVAVIPVSVRTEREAGAYGNSVASMVTALPTDEPNLLVRLRRCRRGMLEAKNRHNTVPTTLMRDVNDLVPPMLFGQATRTVTRLASSDSFAPAANLVISNVPGPRNQLFFAGRAVRENFPISTISDSLGLNITVFSYFDRLQIGLVGDREIVDDLDGLACAFHTELQLMQKVTADMHAEGATR
ncbi:wax ester/triacylglycerol synthase family O-acyltransferase [Gordonia sp. HNM0687]|uniref:Diacylglycerol O-acyltransferase n=1 Tax=Gordonia mangrovi TaxID=2665643 RepID=A0A6L7GWD1_9ACTN|nr:wax ester/triacylglycerol synthase family O-acyltransferase [Gordonia mangrovi]MDY6808260.1 wax ester/triacylglycerol synthase family O-acyltransferase [Actinomycetota bacterium]MXP24230.1 wax ester/triacylglycerol synthase family O-acyltransferase [Gordonia mangrovi]UVF76878.1 wax ester/triacylglycerol synthase family O-acyltransferase [Gordonia mangrovi]